MGLSRPGLRHPTGLRDRYVGSPQRFLSRRMGRCPDERGDCHQLHLPNGPGQCMAQRPAGSLHLESPSSPGGWWMRISQAGGDSQDTLGCAEMFCSASLGFVTLRVMAPEPCRLSLRTFSQGGRWSSFLWPWMARRPYSFFPLSLISPLIQHLSTPILCRMALRPGKN